MSAQANAKTGYKFDHWTMDPKPSGFNTTANPVSFVNDEARKLTAYFVGGTMPVTPSPPTNVAASDGTYSTKITISWSASSGATSYEIYRATSSSGSKTNIDTASSTNYSDSAISCPNTYYYWIKAKNSSGTSDFSASDSGYCSDTAPPPTSGAVEISVEKAKEKIDENKDLIIVDVSNINDFEDGHLLCAENISWNSAFDFLNPNRIADYKTKEILIYDQEDTYAQTAAEYLVETEGFTIVYYMTGGLAAWVAEGFETTTTDGPCSLPPMAHAGPDQTVDENDAVSLDASKSSDPNGGQPTYAWKQVSGTAHAVLNDPSSRNPSFTAPPVQEGGDSLIFYLTVTNPAKNSDTDSVTILVNWVSTPPVAEAGPPQTVKESDLVTLNGSASTDIDDGIQSYQWVQTGGPTVELTDAGEDTATFTAPDIEIEPTLLTFRLTVIDQGGKEDTDEVEITIMAKNDKPVADAGDDATVIETHTVTLDGSASADPDGTIIEYQWSLLSGLPVTILNSDREKATFVAPATDTDNTSLTFQLIVYDDAGQASDRAEVTFTVENVGEIPFAHAGPEQTVYEGAIVTLDASLSKDSDGAIDSYQWVQVSGPEVTLSGESTLNPQFSAPILVDETTAELIFEVTVTDNDTLRNSDQVVILVQASAPPVANAGADQSLNEGKMVILDGSLSSDPDDGIKSYSWVQTSGTTAELSDASAEKPEFNAPKIKTDEVLTFQLTVEDFSGRTSTDEVKITVNNKSSSSGTCFISGLD